jgi:hypothetical protein
VRAYRSLRAITISAGVFQLAQAVLSERLTVARDEPFVLFLIGMRFNKPWKIGSWWSAFTAMPRMLQELERHPELGCYGGHLWFGRTTVQLQYWRSFEALDSYARSRDHAHLPAWTRFQRELAGSGDVGIWHETYEINPGSYEVIYSGMPPFGLGRVGPVVPAQGGMASARARKGGGAPAKT